MDALRQRLRAFNAHSRDTEDHLKLCSHPTASGTRHEIRLCSSHPRFVTCTADLTHIHIQHSGPDGFSRSLTHDQESLRSLLALLQDHRDDTDTLLDWELEDWVSAGYPCQMHTRQPQSYFPDLGFMPEDLWCIDELPSINARI
jgi:hypothetical protein